MPQWRRYLRSLRVRAAAVVLVVAVAPLLFVATANLLEDRKSARMTHRLRDAADRVAQGEAPQDVARQTETWVRVIEPDGTMHSDARHARGGASTPSMLERLFDDDAPPDLYAVDETLGPVLDRDEIRRQHADGCRVSTGQRMLLCFAAMSVDTPAGRRLVFVEDGVRRSIQSLHDLWDQLITLTAVIVPLAAGLGLWLGWRMVRPLEKLQAQVRRQMPGARGSRLSMPRSDEFGDLASDFNELLRRLDEHARETEAFVADLAHEFKNPVATVRAAADALEARPDDRDRVERLAGTLHRSAVQLDELVSQFLDLARAEAGFAGESRGAVDIAALTRAVVDDVAADPRRSALTITVDAPGEAVVDGLATRIEVAIRNLLGNACDFASARVQAHVRPERSAVVVAVTDDGPGIPRDEQSRIFERFYSRRRGGGGTGLGLAMVRATAHAHGGAVEVDSEPGEGSTLRLLLPR